MEQNTDSARGAGDAGARPTMAAAVGVAVVVLLLISALVGFFSARDITARDARTLDVQRAAAAGAALDSSVTRAVRGLESLLALLDAPEHSHPADFDRFARSTVGTEDFAPTLRLAASDRRRTALEVRGAVMTGHDRGLVGTRITDRTLRDAIATPAAAFGVVASTPTSFNGRRGVWFAGPDPTEALGSGRRFIASFVASERFASPTGAHVTVDGRTLAGTPPEARRIARSFETASRTWQVALAPARRPLGSRALPWLILAVGTVLAVVAGMAGGRLRQSQRLERERAEQRVEVMAAAAEERGRLARDLHDSVSQALFSMTLQARTAQLGVEREGIDPDGPIGRPVRELADLTRAALAEIRALIFELRPQALEEEGFVTALRKHAAALAARERRTIEVTGPADRIPIDDLVEEQLFRVALEAVHNAARHADAERIDVRVTGPEDGRVRVEVLDDGRGFDPSRPTPGHFGLETMRERVDRLGGELQISSTPGAGTAVTVDVPLNEQEPTTRWPTTAR